MAAGSTKVVVAALIGNGLIAITKFGAAAYTGSSAMLSEAIHSVVDTGTKPLFYLESGNQKNLPMKIIRLVTEWSSTFGPSSLRY